MADNQILEEEYDPNYVPTKEEIDEYAEFIGMDLEDDGDKELMWIAEEGLKAPLPSEWKPCKTDDDDIYYFNFDSGESRWEHPCDEYYKKLYKSEKVKQRQSKSKQSEKAMSKMMAPLKKVKSQKQKSSTQIENNFDSMFQDEIDQILVSDIVSSDESVSLTPKKERESKQIAQKLHEGLAALVPKTDQSNIPTFHLDLSTDVSQQSENAENVTTWKNKANEAFKEEKKSYLEKLQKELKTFKEEAKKSQTAKIEKQISSEMKSLSDKLQNAAKEKEIALEESYETKWRELRALNDYNVSKSADDFQMILKKNRLEIEDTESKHRNIINAMKHEQETKVKELKIKHNENENQILNAHKTAIEELKKNHKKYLVQIQESMKTDIENLTNKQQKLQQQSNSLQLFKENNIKMKNDFDNNLEQLQIEHDNKMSAAKLEWDKAFIDARNKHEIELKEFVSSIEQSKVDCLSAKEVTDYREKYAADIEQRKEKIKITMLSEYENWKNQKKKFYQHCKEKDIQNYEEELNQKMAQKKDEFEKEIEQLQNIQNDKIQNIELDFSKKIKKINEQNKEKMDQISERHGDEIKRMQNEMREREQSRRDELRNEYKLKFDALANELKAQQARIENNIESNAELKASNVFEEKYKKLQSENCKLQHQITEVMDRMKEQKISFSKEKRDLHFKIDGQKNKLLNLQQQIVEYEVAESNDTVEVQNDEDPNVNDEDCSSLYSATLSNSEFVTLQQIEVNENNEIPSNASKWSEYLQKESACIDNMRLQINATKKSLRQKQRKLETMKSGWKKDRDKLKLMSMDTSLTDNKQQFNSFKHMLKKKKHEIDSEVNQINEQILEVRDSSQLLTKRESRLQTLEIEYLRVQNKSNGLALNVSNHSVQSIDYQPYQASTDRNMYDLQQKTTKRKPIAPNDYEIHQGTLNHSNSSIGQHALKSVISKYVKHNQHTRRTINHHKTWLKSFQNELRNVSDSISHEKVTHRHHKHKKHQHLSKRKLHSKQCSNEANKGTGEVVIRVKIEK